MPNPVESRIQLFAYVFIDFIHVKPSYRYFSHFLSFFWEMSDPLARAAARAARLAALNSAGRDDLAELDQSRIRALTLRT